MVEGEWALVDEVPDEAVPHFASYDLAVPYQ